jgi:arginine deiminase
VKKELSSSKEKVIELEDILFKNSEQKRFTEKKYSELVESHKKMFGYIENLEKKVREFQNKRKKRNATNDSISREYSSSFSKNYSVEYKSLKLAITAPLMIFSAKTNI